MSIRLIKSTGIVFAKDVRPGMITIDGVVLQVAIDAVLPDENTDVRIEHRHATYLHKALEPVQVYARLPFEFWSAIAEAVKKEQAQR